MTPDEIEKLQERVMNGIIWLDQHDPKGVFHAWFTAGLTPFSVMPAKSEEQRAAYREYYPARVTFERLETELARVDPAMQPSDRSFWQGGQRG